MSIHDGHRQRTKERFLAEGLDGFSELHVLEFLLFYCIPRKDTNEIAHRLLEKFGSLANVLDATVEELKKTEGISENAAVFLKLIPASGRAYQVSKAHDGEVLDTIEKCGNFLENFFVGRRNEMVYILCLDAKCKLLCVRELAEGSANSAGVPIRKIVEIALSVNATTVVMAHNHPSGVALPSKEDIRTTERIREALQTVDVHLADHIIVSGEDYVSLAQSGLFRPE